MTYEYDYLGRLTKVTDDNGENPDGPDSTVEYEYAWSGARTIVTEKHTLEDHGTWTVESTISSAGLREELQYPYLAESSESPRTLALAYDGLNRLDTITEGTDTIADYAYKGIYLQDRAIGDYQGSPVVRLTFKDTNDLDGYGPWGDITWMRHYELDGPTDIAKLAYGYSTYYREIYQEDLVNSTADELYSLDGLGRVTGFERGDLNGEKDEITGTPAREQAWTLDHVGNWTDFATKDADGNYIRPYEERDHNTTNHIT